MARCRNCDAELRQEWKFCIACGAPVDPVGLRPSPIPSAIRPEPGVGSPAHRRVYLPLTVIPLILGIALGIGGAVLIGYLILTAGGPS